MKYHQLKPKDELLSQYSNLIWEVEGTPEYGSEVILPRGYLEIIFNFSNDVLYTTSKNSSLLKAPLCSIQGFNTLPVQGFYKNHHHFFGIRLKPIAIKHLLGVPSGEITNEVVDLTLIDKSFNDVWHKLIECRTFNEKVEVIKPLFQNAFTKIDKRTEFFNRLLYHDNNYTNLFSVKEFADISGLSERQLQRKSIEFFGMVPNELLRYKKFTTAVKLIHQNNIPLTQIAHESDFFDQSHFIRVFKSFSGLTPKEYKNQMGTLPFHIYKK